MVTYLFTSVLLLGLLVVALYFWQKPANRKKLDGFEAETLRLPPPDSRGLFGGANADETTLAPNLRAAEDLSALTERARNDDKTALQDATTYGDEKLYDEILNCLVERADSDPKLLSLVSYVVGHDLRVNKNLAGAIMESWKQAPDRASTAKMLHIAALSDDLPTYQAAVEAALQFWRDGRLLSVSPTELRSLFDGEFWVLSSGTRRTGAGFMLKRTLARARRELETAARVNE
jgi:hypothetical protein